MYMRWLLDDSGWPWDDYGINMRLLLDDSGWLRDDYGMNMRSLLDSSGWLWEDCSMYMRWLWDDDIDFLHTYYLYYRENLFDCVSASTFWERKIINCSSLPFLYLGDDFCQLRFCPQHLIPHLPSNKGINTLGNRSVHFENRQIHIMFTSIDLLLSPTLISSLLVYSPL